VILGPDSTLTYFIEKIGLNTIDLIDGTLNNLREMETQFKQLKDNLTKLLNNEAYYVDKIPFENNYISKGMSKLSKKSSETAETEFEKIILQMYDLDIWMIEFTENQKLENYDLLIPVIDKIYTEEDSRKGFYQSVIKSLILRNPLGSKEELTKQYEEQIENRTIEQLVSRLKSEEQ
jgi:hypothetical protein